MDLYALERIPFFHSIIFYSLLSENYTTELKRKNVKKIKCHFMRHQTVQIFCKNNFDGASGHIYKQVPKHSASLFFGLDKKTHISDLFL